MGFCLVNVKPFACSMREQTGKGFIVISTATIVIEVRLDTAIIPIQPISQHIQTLVIKSSAELLVIVWRVVFVLFVKARVRFSRM